MKDDDGSLQGKRGKRAAPRGRGKAATPSKRGRKSDNSSVHRMLMSKDDNDDDDDEDIAKRLNKSQPRVCDLNLTLMSYEYINVIFFPEEFNVSNGLKMSF